jgi:hypothetical protein
MPSRQTSQVSYVAMEAKLMEKMVFNMSPPIKPDNQLYHVQHWSNVLNFK